MTTQTEVRHKPENPLLNLVFNIVLPVMVLHQLSKRLGENGPLIALVVAISLPIGYGTYDYIKRKKRNYISLLGILNVAVTGSLAVAHLDGMWFSLKEAFFPFLIGTAVFCSNMTREPFMRTLFWNENLFQKNRIEARLRERGLEKALSELFRKATFLFSMSFFISSGLNFILATRIFLPIELSLSRAEHSALLNQQIAKMTMQGYLVIALPMMGFMMLVLWYVISKLKKLSGFSLDELMPNDKSAAKTQSDVSL